MRVFLFVIILAGTIFAQGQDATTVQGNFWNSPQAYLGQQPPGDTPQIFALKLLTQKDTFSFDRVAFSDDGKEFYYPTNTTWFDGKNSKIRYFKYEKDGWKGPFILNEHYYAPTFSTDGRSLYLEGGQPDSLHAHIWRSDRTPDGGWTEPTLFLKADFGLYDLMPTNSGTFYVGSNARQGNRRDYGTYDFCTLRMSAGDTVVESLGSPVNTPGFDGDFFVARDESYMIVSAKEKKDFECELWVTFRRPDKGWTAPVSLGPLIDNRDAHRWGEYVTPDGKYLFYSTGTSPADCHVYWVRFDLLLAKLKKASL
jgi:hypothetical protein